MHTTQRVGAAALVLVVGLVLFGAAAGAGTTQIPPTTVPGFPTETTVPGFPATTVPGGGVLVPSTTVAASTATTAATSGATATSAPAADSSDSADPDAERTVWFAIAGLGVVAFLIIVLTIIYARHTRPDRWHGGQDDWDVPDAPEEAFAPTAARSVFERQEDEQSFWWAED